MSRPTSPIKLSASQNAIIQAFVRCREATHSLVQRAQIILGLSQGNTNIAVAKELGLSDETVGLWRKRWVDGSSYLEEIEKKEMKEIPLQEKIIELLTDKPRSGRPDTFTAEQICLVVALACEKPPEYITHWTRTELVREVVKRGIAESISASCIGRILAEADLKPHRSRYWLNHEVDNEEVFREEVKGNRLDPPHYFDAEIAADAREGAGLPLRRSAMIFAKYGHGKILRKRQVSITLASNPKALVPCSVRVP